MKGEKSNFEGESINILYFAQLPTAYPQMDIIRNAFRTNDTFKIVQMLQGALSVQQLNSLDSDGLALIHIATQKNALNHVQLLHAKGANLNQPTLKGQTALHLAVNAGFLQTAKFLIKNGANLDAQDTSRNTPLHIAVENLRLDMVELLCTSGTALDVLNKQGDAPVHIAASKADGSACISALAKAGANIDVKRPRTGETALFVAAAANSVKIVSTFLDLGADPTIRNSEGLTAGEVAHRNKAMECSTILRVICKSYRAEKAASTPKEHASSDSSSPQLLAMQYQLDQLRLQNQQLSSNARKLQENNDKQQAAAKQAASELSSFQQRYEELAQELQKTNEELLRSVASAQSATELKQLRSQVSMLTEQNRVLRDTAAKNYAEASAMRGVAEQSQQRLCQAESDLAQSRQQNDDLRRQFTSIKNENTSLQQALKQMNSDRTARRQPGRQSADMTRKLEDVSRQLESTQIRLEQATIERNEAADKIRELKRYIRSLQKSQAANEAESNDAITLTAEVVRCRQTIRELEAHVTQLQAVVDQPNFIPFGVRRW